jgi:hypothetical protein
MNSTVILILAAIVLTIAAFLLLSKRPADRSSTPVARSTHAAPSGFAPRVSLSIQDTPDTPQSFGYKMAWFAIPTDDSAKIITVLGLKDAIRANWASGVSAVYSDISHVFVTPPVEGWTLVLGLGLPSFDTPERTREFLAFIDKLAASFPAFCYFGTHRVVEFQGWVKVANGKIERAYAYLGERGETLYESGKKSPEEIALGFAFFDERLPEAASPGYYERKDLRFPEEEDVMKIAAIWTINTQTLNKRTEKGTGYLTKLSQGPTNGLSR